MIRDVILPQLAMGMSEGTIVEWVVAEGACVVRDQALVSIETEKVVTELPAPYAGFVHVLAPVGANLPIETLIAKIADTEAEYRSLVAGVSVAAPRAMEQEPAATPALAGVSPASANDGSRKIRVSGLAKAIATQNKIDLSQISGTGPGGRVIRRDVLLAIERAASQGHVSRAGENSPSGGMRVRARMPVTGMRAAIAQKMLAAKTTAAETYAFFEIDITKLLAARKTILGHQSELATRISLLSFYARAVALVCQQVPICNSTLVNGEITVWENVNVGLAVALPGRTEYESGLIVPVIREVQSKALLQIDMEIKDLVKRARTSALSPTETTDATITISSTDGFLPGGWMVSTPLLNLPQIMNFQPGTPVEKPIVVDGKIKVRTILPCGVTFDHRAMDGEPLGRFVRKLRDLLANPELMLL
ncbi:MAG TPA: dihydrolipoamide acetyltransferase family protein [Candidimonas sp.]|nr:dihydrolipoamide acetyltransferase family protein [Candidimonas sp.]